MRRTGSHEAVSHRQPFWRRALSRRPCRGATGRTVTTPSHGEPLRWMLRLAATATPLARSKASSQRGVGRTPPLSSPRRVVEVRHSDSPPSALVVHTPLTNESLSCLPPGDNKRIGMGISWTAQRLLPYPLALGNDKMADGSAQLKALLVTSQPG